ncbi:MAG: molybdopterin-binding protein [Calditrichaceae bacterium]
MNQLTATITAIESSGHISLVDLKAGGAVFSCVVIENPESADYLKTGTEVSLLFKETEVSIAKNFSGEISLRNRIDSEITGLEKGAILTKITLKFNGLEIRSIITTRSADRLELKPGDRVTGLIKANEISIMQRETDV